nr:uncharacterized protein LOC122173088 [Chrysemys picta bellii]
MAGGAHDAPEGRFQKRLRLLTSQGTRTSVLEVQTLHMSDSGTFFCASPRQNTTPISVTITPGCPAGASIAAVPKEPVGEGASVSLSCTPCGAQGPTSPPAGGATWLLNGKPPPDSTALRIRRSNKVTIENFSSRWEGLWSCRLPGDPPLVWGLLPGARPGGAWDPAEHQPHPHQFRWLHLSTGFVAATNFFLTSQAPRPTAAGG